MRKHILPILFTVTFIIYAPKACFFDHVQAIGKNNLQEKQDLKVALKSTLLGRKDDAKAGVFNTDGKTLVSWGEKESALLWDVASERVIANLYVNKFIGWLAFSPDGKKIAISDAEGIIRLFDTNSGASKVDITERDVFVRLSFSPNSRILATSSSKSSFVSLRDVETGRTVRVLQHPKQRLRNYSEEVGNVAFNPDGQTIATSDFAKVYLWNATSGKLEAELVDEDVWMLDGLKEYKGFSHGSTIYHLSFSPDGKTLGTASRDGTAKLWDMQTRKLKAILKHKNKVVRVFFSPDSKTVATLSEDKTAKLWDVATGQLKATLKHKGTVWSLSFSFDNRMVATYSDNEHKANIWDASTGELLSTLNEARGPVMFSPKENLLATGSKDNKVLLWKVSY